MPEEGSTWSARNRFLLNRQSTIGSLKVSVCPLASQILGCMMIVASSPTPVLAAGGPKCETLDEALEMMRQVVEAGGRGATIGRNIWGAPDPAEALRKFQAVIHGDEA